MACGVIKLVAAAMLKVAAVPPDTIKETFTVVLGVTPLLAKRRRARADGRLP